MVALPSGLQLGDVVADKYRITRIIGSGAMGIVVAAHHLNLDRTVAIKFLLAEAVARPDAIARFVREARAAASIASPHVVRVNDVAVLPNGIPYMELEYLEGRDLSVRLKEVGRLSVGQAVDFVLQACDAIAEAHGLGIVHRDLKPANLFAVSGFAHTETIKVLDFGVSKAKAWVASTLASADGPVIAISTARAPIGSPCYMSPEQMQSARDVDQRTDIWSLGITLCELLTGEVPFRGQSLVELYAEIKSRHPPRLRSRCPDIPEKLEAVLHKCLEFDRNLRFGSVHELAPALLPFASNRTASYVHRIVKARSGLHSTSGSGAAMAGSEPVSGAEPWVGTRRFAKLAPEIATVARRWSTLVLVAVGIAALAMRLSRDKARPDTSGLPDRDLRVQAQSAERGPVGPISRAEPPANEAPSTAHVSGAAPATAPQTSWVAPLATENAGASPLVLLRHAVTAPPARPAAIPTATQGGRAPLTHSVETPVDVAAVAAPAENASALASISSSAPPALARATAGNIEEFLRKRE